LRTRGGRPRRRDLASHAGLDIEHERGRGLIWCGSAVADVERERLRAEWGRAADRLGRVAEIVDVVGCDGVGRHAPTDRPGQTDAVVQQTRRRRNIGSDRKWRW